MALLHFRRLDGTFFRVDQSHREGCFHITARFDPDDEQSFGDLVDAVVRLFPENPEILQRAHGVREDEPIFLELDLPAQGRSLTQVCNIIRGIALGMGYDIPA